MENSEPSRQQSVVLEYINPFFSVKHPFDKDTLKLLRIPFSYFLMPVFVFALSRVESIDLWGAIGTFLALHLFIYPASNGYNSYIDQDEGPIGGLERPPKPSRNLFWAALVFDILGLGIMLLVDWRAFLLVLGYMLASRAYSSPQLRLKGLPWVGFFTVMIFQGAVTFAMVYLAVGNDNWEVLFQHWPALVGSSLLIAGVYPLTQVYQHEEDTASGDRTISLLLGYRGTFLFSMAMFMAAVVLVFLEFYQLEQMTLFYVFLGALLPALLYFNWWMLQVWKDTSTANFKNTMRMNALASTCMNLAFFTMILLTHFS